MSALLACLEAFFAQEGNAHTFWLAFSGGLDSHVLLHLCVQLKERHALQLRAIHINHQLHPDAAVWEEQAAEQAAAYGIPFDSISVQVSATSNLEANARAARYAVFAEKLTPGDILLTAHHAEDQAETVLLQLLRGSGLPGLSAMPYKTPFANGFHARPLLSATQESLQAYAKSEKLTWILDPSNANPQFSRNYLRHHIMPLLKARWPSYASTFARSASLCQEAQTLLDEQGKQLLQQLAGSMPNTLSLQGWKALTPLQQRLVLRYWLAQQGIQVPELAKLMTLQHQLQSAAVHKQPQMSWGNVSVRRYRDDIFVLPAGEEQLTPQSLTWDLQLPLSLPGSGVLTATPVGRGRGFYVNEVVVKTRVKGERVKLAQRRGSRELKTLMQTLGIPPWLRARLPLIFHAEMLICIPGYFTETHFLAQNHQDGFEFSWNCR